MSRLKQLAIPAHHVVIGDDAGRGTSLPPGTDGQVLVITDGMPTFGTPPQAVTYQRRNFTEAGPTGGTTTIHALTTTLPANLQGGNKDGLIVLINGLGIDLTAITLEGSGPYVVKLNMNSIGYSLDEGDTVAVHYLLEVQSN